jgi:hypothetical protein
MNEKKSVFHNFNIGRSQGFGVRGKSLAVSRRWIVPQPDLHRGAEGLQTSITGVGVSTLGSVCVIGKNRETKEFDLNVVSDENVKRQWESSRNYRRTRHSRSGAVDGHAAELISRIEENLDKAPPTASLFTFEDELRGEFGWTLWCAIPAAALAKLEVDLLGPRPCQLHIAIEWASALVKDEHAPPGYPNVWGLLTVSPALGPEPLQGHVTGLHWHISERTAE